MLIEAQVYPTMPTRPCRFCLSLQGGSVFADFDIDSDGCAFLRRISFDGYGCCDGDFDKMGFEESQVLVEAMESGALEGPKIDTVLRSYFRKNAGTIWSDALESHALL
jgi:hypothetical protein